MLCTLLETPVAVQWSNNFFRIFILYLLYSFPLSLSYICILFLYFSMKWIVKLVNTPLTQSSTGTVFVRVNGRPSTADQVVRYLTSSTAAELHPTQRRKRSGAYSTRVHKFSFARHGGDIAYLAYPTVAYSHVRGLRTNTYDLSRLNGIRPSLGRVRSHSAEYVVCSRRVAMPLHIMGSVGRIRPYTGDDLLGRIGSSGRPALFFRRHSF
jgi:hypothetical protein